MTDMWSRSPRARRWLLILEILAAGALCALSILVAASGSSSWWGLPATFSLFIAFLVRRRSIAATFGFAALSGALQLISARGFIMFGDILYAPVCAAFGAHRDPRIRRLGLAAAVSAAVVPGALVLPRWLSGVSRPPGWFDLMVLCLMFTGVAALISVGGWTWGYLRLQQQLRVESVLAAQLSEAERIRLEETYAQSAFRERIAAEMHDVVGHSWAVVAAQADGARYALEASPEAAAQALDTIADVARTSITELREILRQLRYSEGTEGQVSAEQQAALLDRMRAAGMTLTFHEDGEPAPSGPIRLAAYRVLTEALTNALKHGDLSRPVRVVLVWTGGFTLDVENRIAHASRLPGSGLGIDGMRSRAHSLGGSLEAQARDDGWHLHVEVPAPLGPDTSVPGPSAVSATDATMTSFASRKPVSSVSGSLNTGAHTARQFHNQSSENPT